MWSEIELNKQRRFISHPELKLVRVKHPLADSIYLKISRVKYLLAESIDPTISREKYPSTYPIDPTASGKYPDKRNIHHNT